MARRDRYHLINGEYESVFTIDFAKPELVPVSTTYTMIEHDQDYRDPVDLISVEFEWEDVFASDEPPRPTCPGIQVMHALTVWLLADNDIIETAKRAVGLAYLVQPGRIARASGPLALTTIKRRSREARAILAPITQCPLKNGCSLGLCLPQQMPS